MKKTYLCNTGYSTTEITLTKGKYQNGSLRIQAWCSEGPFATLTTCLSEDPTEDNYAYIDTNNNPWAPAFIEENGLGEDTGLRSRSGFCTYPLFRFNVDQL